MLSAGLPLYTPTASIMTRNPNPKTFSFYTATARKSFDNSLICKAAYSSSSSSIMDFDLYDLLGIDSSSDQSQIKTAYRSLQKQCHPDIAGPPGHDMAIILNDAYSVLSDPSSRLVYDKKHAKIAELRGYTGKPIYSVWFGSESEQRAVFVDEVKCIGCLKCALFAGKTFAIESVYGRARVVAQWADPEHKIQEAIETCPVNCISVVERSNLAALEFLMSKQPRGNVRIGASNAVGTRVSNIFADVKKFQTRFSDAMDKASMQRSNESDPQREARMSAIQAIRSISNWLYWQSPNEGGSTSETPRNLTYSARKDTQPNINNINKLREAAAARKQARENTRRTGRIPTNYIYDNEYWIPLTLVFPTATQNNSGSKVASESSPTTERKETSDKDYIVRENNRSNPMRSGIQIGAATIAAVIVRLQVGQEAVGGLEKHIGGSLALDIVNSSWLQVILAGITWYLIGMAMVELVGALRNRAG